MQDKAESITAAIANAEARAGVLQETAPDFETKVAIWFEMEARTAHLQALARLCSPSVDQDCRLAGCGVYGRSII